jgi:hypothetical protein
MMTGMLVLSAGPVYLEAQGYWLTPNNCVEAVFKPATRERRVRPGESVKIEVEIRKKQDRTLPAKLRANEYPGNHGRVSPAEANTTADKPATFTYTAPSRLQRDLGIEVAAASRAGQAGGSWRIRYEPLTLKLELESIITARDPGTPAVSRATASVPLTITTKQIPAGHHPALPAGTYDLREGIGTLSYETAPLPHRDPCSSLISGKGTTEIKVIEAYVSVEYHYDRNGNLEGAAVNIAIPYWVGLTHETERYPYVLQHKCVPGNPEPNGFWSTMFYAARDGEEVNLLRNWTFVGKGGVLATKTLKSTCHGLCDEVSTFTLREVPEEPRAK